MNLAMVYNDERFFSPGAFLMKVFSQQPEISILAHPRIPEDLGIVEEQNNLNLDLKRKIFFFLNIN